MKSFSLAALAIATFLASGCVSSTTMAVSDASPVRPTYEQGIAVLKSQKQNSVVVRLLTEEFSKEINALPSFFVVISNGTDAPMDFSTASIEAYSGSTKVRVHTYESVIKKIKREAALQAFAVAMNSASQSMAASMQQTAYTSGTVNAYGPNGYARANYAGYTTTYNPAAVATANAQINANTMNQMSMIASSRDIQMQNVSSMLRRNTVQPGEIVGGVIKLYAEDIEEEQPLRLVVILGSETHEFVFDVGG